MRPFPDDWPIGTESTTAWNTTMHSRTPSLLSIFYVTFFATCGHSRHIHHKPVHKHIHRAATSPTPITLPSSLPSVTAGNAVIDDIQEIEKGLSALPNDILAFFAAIEQRLEQVEGLLGSLLASSSVTAPLQATTEVPLISTSQSAAMGASASSVPLASVMATSAAASSSPQDTTYTVDITSTITTTTRYTVTHQLPTPTGHFSNYTFVPSNVTLPHPTGSNLSTTPSAVPPVTYTVAFAKEVVNSAGYGETTLTTSATTTYTMKPPTAAEYTFRPHATDNVAVYYGQSPDTQAKGLLALCESPNVDIVMLSFLMTFFGPGGYPAVEFGPACWAPNPAQAKKAPGLLDCVPLATEIAECQKIGKKVLLSLGGYLANTSFVSDAQAETFAGTLWNLFGGGTATANLRPFGKDVVIDGFDVDNENHKTSFYNTFAKALRKEFAKDKKRTYYLSAAPQCPIPDESIPLGLMSEADFVWVQFYNNPQCNLNSTGFGASFAAWSNQLRNNSRIGTPRLYIGAGAFAGAGSGYVPGKELKSAVKEATELNVDNMGGIMLWDGSEAMANIDRAGKNYLQYAKAAVK